VEKWSVKCLCISATVTEDEESEETEKDTPDDGFTVPSDITGMCYHIVI